MLIYVKTKRIFWKRIAPFMKAHSFELRQMTPLMESILLQNLQNVCSFSPNGKQIASIVDNNLIHIWETTIGVCTNVFRDHESCFISF